MIVLGIDPGYGIVGYGAIEWIDTEKLSLLCYGAITTSSNKIFCDRLNSIYKKMVYLISRVKPDVLVVEKLFFKNNQKTAIDVAQARGVILLSGQQSKIRMEEFTPLQVKMAVTGYGRAKKPQVMETVKKILRLKELPEPDDAADAVALAICYSKFTKKTENALP